MQLFSCEQANR